MKNTIFLILLLFPLLSIAQEETYSNKGNTSFSLNYGINITNSSQLLSQSIGGDWGFVVDHIFGDSRFGVSAGINYSLINIGPVEGITNPRDAIEFGFLESDFGFIFLPFYDIRPLRLRVGYTHALIVRHENIGLDRFNIPVLTAGVEYAFSLESSLALAIGFRTKLFVIDQTEIGRNLTNSLYFKIGLKN